MAYLHDTASDHLDLFQRIRTFVKTGLGSGNWTELRYDAVNVRALFEAPGLSGDQSINIGMWAEQDAGADVYAIGFFMFKAYVAGLDDLSQPGTSIQVWHCLWDDDMPFWCVANGQRLILATKVSTVYSSSHVGKLLPGGTPGEYPQPYYLAANALSFETRWSNPSPEVRCFFDPGQAARILRPDGGWWTVQNVRDNGGGSIGFPSGLNYVWPYAAVQDGSGTAVISRLHEMRENLDGSYPLHPLIVHGQQPAYETMGEIDGAYHVPGTANASEDTITIDGQVYLVLQDMSRTDRFNYCALKLL
jgi:hypothetical protein